jgi:hemerythrin
LKKRVVADEPLEMNAEFIEFIEAWVQEHYAKEDVKMAQYINSRSN